MAHDGTIAEPHKSFCLLEGGRKPERCEATGSPIRENRYELNFRLNDVFSRNGQPAESLTVTESGHEGDGDPLGAMMVTNGHDGGYSAMMETVNRCARASSLSVISVGLVLLSRGQHKQRTWIRGL